MNFSSRIATLALLTLSLLGPAGLTSTSAFARGNHQARTSMVPMPVDPDTCPGSTLIPTPNNLATVRHATLCLINQERLLHGESALRSNSQLNLTAQRHNQDMVTKDYFEHDGPQGDTLLSRIQQTNYIYSRRVGYMLGENISWGTRSLATASAAVDGWIESPDHLANILNPRFRDTGISVAAQAPESVSQDRPAAIYTQDFGVIITG